MAVSNFHRLPALARCQLILFINHNHSIQVLDAFSNDSGHRNLDQRLMFHCWNNYESTFTACWDLETLLQTKIKLHFFGHKVCWILFLISCPGWHMTLQNQCVTIWNIQGLMDHKKKDRLWRYLDTYQKKKGALISLFSPPSAERYLPTRRVSQYWLSSHIWRSSSSSGGAQYLKATYADNLLCRHAGQYPFRISFPYWRWCLGWRNR